MGFSCKSKTATAVTTSTSRRRSNSHNNLEIFRYKDLDAATNAFSQKNLLHTTRHGELFRAHLPDGRAVAVKRPHHAAAAAAAFHTEAQILSKLFSRRLVNLLGYCNHDNHSTLLVLEHMERGTVEENLRELAWRERVQLAVDVAKAIRALHASSPRIVHCNLRSANVFLDHEGRARLGDFCLARSSSCALESIPEGAHDEFDARAADPKVDVFSFGVVLLELISGRVGDRDRLIDWALPLVRHGHHMALCDPRIVPFPADGEAVRLLANVAARCVRSVGARRPSMDEVVQSLTRASKLVITPNLPQTLPLTATPVKVRSSAPWLVVKKKKRALVFRLSRFLARKLRIGRSSYNKMHRSGTTSSILKAAEDHDQRERSVVEQVLQHKRLILGGISGRDRKVVVRSRSVPGLGGFDGRRSTSEGKKFVRLTTDVAHARD